MWLDKNDLKIGGLLLILSCIFFWEVLLNPDKIMYAPYFFDIINQHSMLRYFTFASLRETGELPLWNSHIYMGHPNIGDPQFSFSYLLPTDTSFGYLFIFYVFLLGVFTYLFMHKGLMVDKYSSMISAIIFMFAGTNIAHIYAGHIGDLDVLAWMPLSFLLLEFSIKRRSYFYAVLTGIPLGLQFLGGNIQISLYTVFALAVYFLLRIGFVLKKRMDIRVLFKLLSIFVLACIIGLLLSAIKTFPVAEFVPLSARVEKTNYKFATGYSFPPEQAMVFLMPEFFGTFLDVSYWGGRNFWQLTLYTGIFSLILAFLIFLIKDKRYKDYKLIFTATAIFAMMFSLGKYFIVYPFFYYFVPFFDLFRKPAAMLFLVTFSISILAGFGFSFLQKRLDKKQKKRLWLLIKLLTLVLIFSFTTTFFVYFEKEYLLQVGQKIFEEKYHLFTTNVHNLRYDYEFYMAKIPVAYRHVLDSVLIFSTFLGLITVVLYLRLKEKISLKQFKIFVILIILIDLWFFGMKYIDVEDPNKIFSDRIPLNFLKEDKTEFRICTMSGGAPNFILVRHHSESITGYATSFIKSYRDFITYFLGKESDWEIEPFIPLNTSKLSESYTPKILGLLNVKYIIVDEPVENDGFEMILNTTRYVYRDYLPTDETINTYVYKNTMLLPRAYAVPNAVVVSRETDVFKMMELEDFDPKETIILEEDIGVPLNNLGTYKRADITYYSPNGIEIEVYMDDSGFLVLSENYYPGWTATDNGKETEIYKANYILRSVYLTEGQHTIKFVYNPFSFRLGLSVTVITALSLFALVLYRIRSNLQKRGE